MSDECVMDVRLAAKVRSESIRASAHSFTLQAERALISHFPSILHFLSIMEGHHCYDTAHRNPQLSRRQDRSEHWCKQVRKNKGLEQNVFTLRLFPRVEILIHK